MKFNYLFNFWQEIFNKSEFVENNEVDIALGKMSVDEVFEKAFYYGKENGWESKPKIVSLRQNLNSNSFFWSVQFELDPEINEYEYEYGVGSLGKITIDDETGEVLEVHTIENNKN